MQEQAAQDLSNALDALENARVALIQAPPGSKASFATEYERAKRGAFPAFAAVSREYDATNAPSPSAPEPEEAAEGVEASPGVPLVAAPDVIVTAANLSHYGAMAAYRTKANPTADLVEATPYAFASGTGVTTGQGDFALTQPSRLILGGTQEAPELAIVTDDIFNATYEKADPVAPPSPGSAVPAETPVPAPAEDPPAPAEAPETPAPEQP